MGLLKIATVPPPAVSPEAAVRQAVDVMCERDVGAVVVIAGGRLSGIFTERDLMRRVVARRLDPEATLVSEVMTREVTTALRDMRFGDALELMVGKNFRHLPVVDADGNVIGILSTRDLYEHAVERLKDELNLVVNYLGADGPGGD